MAIKFRTLANMGATVVILHHTGKAESSKLYRGSSDIKAAVDTAYLLERAEENTPEIRKLVLKCFKARLALGQNFSMEFRRGLGFVPAEAGKTVREIIQDVLREYPRSNQADVIKLCVARCCSKSQVEVALKNGNWQTERGPKNAKLYVLPKPSPSPQESES